MFQIFGFSSLYQVVKEQKHENHSANLLQPFTVRYSEDFETDLGIQMAHRMQPSEYNNNLRQRIRFCTLFASTPLC